MYVLLRSFGQLRCTDSCLIDSTGCKYFTWTGRWKQAAFFRLLRLLLPTAGNVAKVSPCRKQLKDWERERVLKRCSCSPSDLSSGHGIQIWTDYLARRLNYFVCMGLREQLPVTVTPSTAALLWTLEPFHLTHEIVMYCRYDLLTVHAEISYVVNLFISISNISIVASEPAVQMFIHVACVYQLTAVCFYLLMYLILWMRTNIPKMNGMKNNSLDSTKWKFCLHENKFGRTLYCNKQVARVKISWL